MAITLPNRSRTQARPRPAPPPVGSLPGVDRQLRGLSIHKVMGGAVEDFGMGHMFDWIFFAIVGIPWVLSIVEIIRPSR